MKKWSVIIKRSIILIVLAGLMALFSDSHLHGEKVAELSRVMRPFHIDIGHGRMYVVEEDYFIHIYQLDLNNKKIKFVKDFGRRGEGPGEFQFIHSIRIQKDHLEIPTQGKFARFTFDGKLIDEVKLPIRVFKGGISKIGKNYLVREINFDSTSLDRKVKLYDRNFKILKEIGVRTEDRGFERVNLISGYYSAEIFEDRIYTAISEKETQVMVLDKLGELIHEFTLPIQPTRVTPELKERKTKPVKEEFKRSGYDWNEFHKRLYFPKYTPGLDYFNVTGNKIITRTYKYKGDLVEFIVFDLKGEELKKIFLYDTGRTSQGIPFCVYKDHFVVLKENTDAEVWELHIQRII